MRFDKFRGPRRGCHRINLNQNESTINNILGRSCDYGHDVVESRRPGRDKNMSLSTFQGRQGAPEMVFSEPRGIVDRPAPFVAWSGGIFKPKTADSNAFRPLQ